MQKTTGGYVFKEMRQAQIYEYVKKHKSASVNDMVSALFASHATIRRDLIEMEKQGAIKRTHGGAMIIEEGSFEASQELRAYDNVDKKMLIAPLALPFLQNGTSIFLDSSTTNRFLISHLMKFHDQTIITNSIKSASMLMPGIDGKIILAGGVVSTKTNNTVGALTVDFLKNFRTNIALIACRGISQTGCTVVSTEHAAIKQAMIKNAKTRILLCDSTKFNIEFMVKFADFSDFDFLLTDTHPDSALSKVITESGCKIISVSNNQTSDSTS